MRPLVLVAFLVGCVDITDPTFDNPCDPAHGGACEDAETAPPVPDATTTDARIDRGHPVIEADAEPPDAKAPDPDMGQQVACEPSGFTQNVVDCPERLEGLCAFEFNVAPDFLSCDSFCRQIGRACLRAWFAHSQFYCRPVQEDRCDARVQEMVCACSER